MSSEKSTNAYSCFFQSSSKNPSLELHIFGKGELYNVLNDEIEILNLKSCVFLEGETSNVKKNMNNVICLCFLQILRVCQMP